MMMIRILIVWTAFITLIGCKDVHPSVPPTDVMVTAEGKKEMILLTDRPPNLEAPLKYFLQDYTPNDVFFVRNAT